MGHNSDGLAGEQLASIIQRIERIDEEIAAIKSDRKEIFTEAAGNGFDVPTLRAILKERAQIAKHGKEVLAEREALLDTYRAALGGLADMPLGRAAMERV